MSRLFLSDVSDFILPSSECVKPVRMTEVVGAAEIPLVDFGDDLAAKPVEWKRAIMHKSENSTATVSLMDCLSCSMCITTAETILILDQSVLKLKAFLSEKAIPVVMVLTTQSLASIAVQFSLTPEEAFHSLRAFFLSQGVSEVLSSDVFAQISLHLSVDEFLKVFRGSSDPKNGPRPPWDTPPVTLAFSEVPKGESQQDCIAALDSFDPSAPRESVEDSLPVFPIISSSCPGWICYAEKTYPQTLPHISRVRSPQQIAGALLRELRDDSSLPIRIVSVEPCHDKKLEASRRDFWDDRSLAPQVDLVLTTSDIVSLLKEQSFIPVPLPRNLTSLDPLSFPSDRPQNSDFGSNGFLEHIARAVQNHFGLPPLPLEYVQQRNKDFHEVTLCQGDLTVFRGARVYGMHNMQTILMKMKKGRDDYHYIELMACPQGCPNGGGQIIPHSITDRQTTLEAVKAQMIEIPLSSLVSPLRSLCALRGVSPPDDSLQRHLFTHYHISPLPSRLSSHSPSMTFPHSLWSPRRSH